MYSSEQAEKGDVIVDKILEIELTAPDYPDLVLVDTPGTNRATYDPVRCILQRFAGGEQTFFLLTCPLSTPPSNIHAIGLLQELKLEHRTLAVITQTDIRGNIPPKEYPDLIADVMGQMPGLGYIFTVSQPCTDCEHMYQPERLQHVKDKEDTWFEMEGLKDMVMEGKASVPKLIEQMNKVMHKDYLKVKWLPDAARTLLTRIKEELQQHRTLGLPATHEPLNEAKQRLLQHDIVVRVKELFGQKPSVLSLLMKGPVASLQTAVHDLHTGPEVLPGDGLNQCTIKFLANLDGLVERFFVTATTFFVEELDRRLKEDQSSLKLGRLSSVRESLKVGIREHMQGLVYSVGRNVSGLLKTVPESYRDEAFDLNKCEVTVRFDTHGLAKKLLSIFMTSGFETVAQDFCIEAWLRKLSADDWKEDCSRDRQRFLAGLAVLVHAYTRIVELWIPTQIQMDRLREPAPPGNMVDDGTVPAPMGDG